MTQNEKIKALQYAAKRLDDAAMSTPSTRKWNKYRDASTLLRRYATAAETGQKRVQDAAAEAHPET